MTDFVSRVRAFGLIVTVVLVALSGLLSLVIIRRYESHLARTNANLESLVDRRSQSILRSRDAVVFGLAKLAESRDGDTGGTSTASAPMSRHSPAPMHSSATDRNSTSSGFAP